VITATNLPPPGGLDALSAHFGLDLRRSPKENLAAPRVAGAID